MNDDSQIKNETDQELLNLLKSIAAKDKKFCSSVKQLIKEWATTKSIRTKVDTDKSEAPRAPYSFETDTTTYGLQRIYFHADLADMNVFNVDKKIFRPKYCLVMIDGVSRKIYLRSCLNKKPSSVIKAFSSINETIVGSEPALMLQTDKGGEFFNAPFREWCLKNRVCHYATETDQAYRAERAIYTLKTLIKRLTTAEKPKINRQNRDTYLLDLEQVINSTPCSYSGCTPNQLNNDDRDSKANRMLDRLKLQKKRKAQWKHNNVTRVKTEKLKILKPLPVNTLVYVRYWKDRDQDTFSKPSTRTKSY